MATEISVTGYFLDFFGLSLLLMSQRRADKIPEQRMWLHRLGFEFGMELTAEEPGMIFNLDNFNQVVVRRRSRYHQAVVFQLLTIGIVKFEPVAVPLGNFRPGRRPDGHWYLL